MKPFEKPHSANPPPDHRRLDHIDALRGIAALAVVFQHAAETTYWSKSNALAASLLGGDFNFGRYGVVVFFVISGFLIPSSIRDTKGAVASFAIGRFFRLYPLYWLSLVLAVLLIPMMSDKHFPPGMVLANITMVQMAFGGLETNVIPLYWTLFVEMIFYVICVGLLLSGLLRRPDLPVGAIFVLGALMTGTSLALLAGDTGRFEGLLMKIGTFSMYLQMMFVGQSIRYGRHGGNSRYGLAVAVSVGSLAIYCVVRHAIGRYDAGLSPMSVFTSSVLGIATFMLFSRAKLSSRLLTYLGAISYGVYLLHPIVLVAAQKLMPVADDMASALLMVTGVAACSILAAMIAHDLVEKPGIELGRAVQRMRGRRLEGAPIG